MKPTSRAFVSVFLVALFQICPNEACIKKMRALVNNKGKEEQPASLHRDESAFMKYSHSQASNNNLYIEITQNENDKSIVVRELDHPPIAMSQVRGDDLQEKMVESTTHARKTGAKSDQAVSSKVPLEPLQESNPVYKGVNGEEEEEEEYLSPEDQSVRREWGGNCTVINWNRCNKIRQIVVQDVINNQFQRKHLELDCLGSFLNFSQIQPILCLTNGWTANRCHILCMAQCNPQLFFDWDGTVDFEGPCRYRK